MNEELTPADDAALERLCREWLDARTIEFVGGPKCGWIWRWDCDDEPEKIWWFIAGRIRHSYTLIRDRYLYIGATEVQR